METKRRVHKGPKVDLVVRGMCFDGGTQPPRAIEMIAIAAYCRPHIHARLLSFLPPLSLSSSFPVFFWPFFSSRRSFVYHLVLYRARKSS